MSRTVLPGELGYQRVKRVPDNQQCLVFYLHFCHVLVHEVSHTALQSVGLWIRIGEQFIALGITKADLGGQKEPVLHVVVCQKG